MTATAHPCLPHAVDTAVAALHQGQGVRATVETATGQTLCGLRRADHPTGYTPFPLILAGNSWRVMRDYWVEKTGRA